MMISGHAIALPPATTGFGAPFTGAAHAVIS